MEPALSKTNQVVLLLEGTRKKNVKILSGSQISAGRINGKTYVIREVPPGVFVRFALKESFDNEVVIRATRFVWVDEGSKVDFIL